ncbi:hypothetical protein BV25DRAFT_1891577 [Artomyces pyxidatus]|uniref:Uncharacterized protein n=1 Tax=Artomyces pyxidatus TaxID=48021 RepID=A0ACB8SP44_9AGAM|nr:hypothetical protein BV25DRAFT_1891577 [Artomyces pyxidatus]
MRRELPGFYFDEGKNRYFPLSSKPKAASHASESNTPKISGEPPRNSPSEHHASAPPPRQKNAWRSLERARSATSRRQIEQYSHSVLHSQIASTSACQIVPLYEQYISALGIETCDDRMVALMGDSNGVLSRCEIPTEAYLSMSASNIPQHWARVFHLGSRISSISMSGPIWITTSFGPDCRIFVHDRVADRTTAHKPHSTINDVWTSHLVNRSLAIGARQRACFVPDIEHLRGLRFLETRSDVFAVHQHEARLYTGARNGSVSRFDTRMAMHKGDALFGVAPEATGNSATFLATVGPSQLLVSTIRGNIALFDVRYPRATRPVLILHGHVNSFMPTLPHAVSPCQSYLFAAGLDRRVRGWSLRTGEPLRPPDASFSPRLRTAEDTRMNPFAMVFPEPVAALQTVDIEDNICLFAASVNELYRFKLGQQAAD